MRSPFIHYAGGSMNYAGGNIYNYDGTLMVPNSIKSGNCWHDEYDSNGLLGTQGWAAFNSGTGAAQSKLTSEAGHNGILQYSTGTTATGRSGHIKDLTGILLGNGITVWEAVVRMTQLSTGTEEFRYRVGLGDQSGDVESVDGIYALYDRANYGNFWNLVQSSNSVRTITTLDGSGGNTTVAVSAATWYRIRAIINAAGNSVSWYIDSTAGTDTLVKTSTTNIPTGSGRVCGQFHGIFKSVGTTAVTADIDAYGYSWLASTQR